MTQPLLYETHTHTPLCKHAVGEPGDYADVAQHRGLRGLVVTCHNPMPEGFSSRVRMANDEFVDYLDMVDRARRRWTLVFMPALGIAVSLPLFLMEGWIRPLIGAAIMALAVYRLWQSQKTGWPLPSAGGHPTVGD